MTFERICSPVVTAGARLQGVKTQVGGKEAVAAGSDNSFRRFSVCRKKNSRRGAVLRKQILLIGMGSLLRETFTWQEG